MQVHCAGCAGCCIDWRAIAPGEVDDHERRGRYRPLDDVYNLVPLTRTDAQDLLDAGFGDAMTPRLFAPEGRGIEIDGVSLAAFDGKPAFFLGLRKPPKPVAPFGREEANWLPACVFLDPATLKCRIHGTDEYPAECAEYPGHNLLLSVETECERVEGAFGGERLVDDAPPTGHSGLMLGPQALGGRVFVHPRPDDLTGVVARVIAGEATAADRAEFVAAAAAGVPGSAETNMDAFGQAYERARTARSWVTDAIEEWAELAGTEPPDPDRAASVEDARGAPRTTRWIE